MLASSRLGSVAAQVIVIVALTGFVVFPLWRIARKMGYSGMLGILALVPGANILLAYVLAFKDWPVLRELDRYRRGARTRAER